MSEKMLPASDDELATLVAETEEYPLCVAKPHDNWDSRTEYRNLAETIKTVIRRGTNEHVRATIRRIGRSVADYAYEYHGRDESASDREALGTACCEVVPRFGRGAVTELHAEKMLPGEPIPGAGDENAGEDIVMESAHGVATFQVKATKYAPSESAKKDADHLIWIPTNDGEYDLENAEIDPWE